MAFVKEFGGTETTNATTLLATGTTTGGHLLVALIHMYTGATNSVSSVTDDGGNTWVAAGYGPMFVSGHSCRGEIWYSFSTSSNATGVTAHFAASVAAVMSVQEHSGSWTYDVSIGASNTGTAASSGTSAALAGSTDLIVAMVGDESTTAITSGGTGYTANTQRSSVATNTVNVRSAYKSNGVSTGELYAATVPSAYWSCGLVAFKPAAGAGAIQAALTASAAIAGTSRQVVALAAAQTASSAISGVDTRPVAIGAAVALSASTAGSNTQMIALVAVLNGTTTVSVVNNGAMITLSATVTATTVVSGAGASAEAVLASLSVALALAGNAGKALPLAAAIAASAAVTAAIAKYVVPTTNLQAWYRADDLAFADRTLVGVVGSTLWNDRSANADAFLQATVANQPIFKTNICNGLPVVRFDGTDDSLQSLTNFSSGTAWSVFMVFAPGNTSAGYVAEWTLSSAPSSTDRAIRQQYTAGTAESFSTPTESLGGVATGVFHLHEWVTGTVNSVGFRDGVQTASVAASTHTNDGDVITLGSSSPQIADFFNGDIAEILYYSVALSTADRQNVESYLAARWGTPAPPSGGAVLTATAALAGSNTQAIALTSSITSSVSISAANAESVGLADAGSIPLANLQAWYEADSLALADGTLVGVPFGASEWMDSRGSNALMQSTPANQPILKTAIRNGLPVVRFDGTDDSLTAFNPFYSGTAWSVFVVFAPGNTTPGYVAEWYSDNSDRAIISQYNGWGLAESYSTPRQTEGGVTPGVFHLHEWVSGAVTTDGSIGYRDGVVQDWKYASTQSNLSNALTLGSSSPHTDFFAGDIAAFLYYSVALSTVDRQKVESYLAAKWGTPAPPGVGLQLSGSNTQAVALAGAISASAAVAGSQTYTKAISGSLTASAAVSGDAEPAGSSVAIAAALPASAAVAGGNTKTTALTSSITSSAAVVATNAESIAVSVLVSVLQFTFNPVGGLQYIQDTSVSDTFGIGDYLEYDIYIDPVHQLDGKVTFDWTFFGTTTPDVDQNGVLSDGTVDLRPYALGQWYSRKIAVNVSLVGFPRQFYFAYRGLATGTLVASFRNVRVTDGAGTVRERIWIDPDLNPALALTLTHPGGTSWSEMLVSSGLPALATTSGSNTETVALGGAISATTAVAGSNTEAVALSAALTAGSAVAGTQTQAVLAALATSAAVAGTVSIALPLASGLSAAAAVAAANTGAGPLSASVTPSVALAASSVETVALTGTIANQVASVLQFTFQPYGGYQELQPTSVSSYTWQAGDYVEYDIYIDPANQLDGDVTFTSYSIFRLFWIGDGNVDQNGVPAAGVDLRPYALGQWYSRKLAVPAVNIGYATTSLLFSYLGTSTGTLGASFRNVRVTDGAGTVRKRIWIDPDSNPTFILRYQTGGGSFHGDSGEALGYSTQPNATVSASSTEAVAVSSTLAPAGVVAGSIGKTLPLAAGLTAAAAVSGDLESAGAPPLAAALSASAALAGANTQAIAVSGAVSPSAAVAATGSRTQGVAAALTASAAVVGIGIEAVNAAVSVTASASVVGADGQAVALVGSVIGSATASGVNALAVTLTGPLTASTATFVTNTQAITLVAGVTASLAVAAGEIKATGIAAALGSSAALVAASTATMAVAAALAPSAVLVSNAGMLLPLGANLTVSAAVAGSNGEAVAVSAPLSASTAIAAVDGQTVAVSVAIAVTSVVAAGNAEVIAVASSLAGSTAISATTSRSQGIAAALTATASVVATNTEGVALSAPLTVSVAVAGSNGQSIIPLSGSLTATTAATGTNTEAVRLAAVVAPSTSVSSVPSRIQPVAASLTAVAGVAGTNVEAAGSAASLTASAAVAGTESQAVALLTGAVTLVDEIGRYAGSIVTETGERVIGHLTEIGLLVSGRVAVGLTASVAVAGSSAQSVASNAALVATASASGANIKTVAMAAAVSASAAVAAGEIKATGIAAALSATSASHATSTESVAATAALVATGAVAGNIGQAHPLAASLSASTAVAGISTVVRTVAAALTGSSAVSGSNVQNTTVSGTVYAAAATMATNAEAVVATAALSPSGAVTGTNKEAVALGAAIAPSAAVSGIATHGQHGTITASVTVAATNKEAVSATGALSASAALAGTNTQAVALAGSITGSAAITGDAGLAASLAATLSGSIAIAGTSAEAAALAGAVISATVISSEVRLASSLASAITASVAIFGAAGSAIVIPLAAELLGSADVVAVKAAQVALAASISAVAIAQADGGGTASLTAWLFAATTTSGVGTEAVACFATVPLTTLVAGNLGQAVSLAAPLTSFGRLIGTATAGLTFVITTGTAGRGTMATGGSSGPVTGGKAGRAQKPGGGSGPSTLTGGAARAGMTGGKRLP